MESRRLRRCTTIAFELLEVRLDAIVFRGETWAALQLFRIANALSISSWETSLFTIVLPALSICFLEYDVDDCLGCNDITIAPFIFLTVKHKLNAS